MTTYRKQTVNFLSDVHKWLRLTAAKEDKNVSEVVNEIIKKEMNRND